MKFEKAKMGCFVVWCQGGEDARHGCSLSIDIAQQSRLPKEPPFLTALPLRCQCLPCRLCSSPSQAAVCSERRRWVIHFPLLEEWCLRDPLDPWTSWTMQPQWVPSARPLFFHADGEPAHTTTLLLHRLKWSAYQHGVLPVLLFLQWLLTSHFLTWLHDCEFNHIQSRLVCHHHRWKASDQEHFSSKSPTIFWNCDLSVGTPGILQNSLYSKLSACHGRQSWMVRCWKRLPGGASANCRMCFFFELGGWSAGSIATVVSGAWIFGFMIVWLNLFDLVWL